MDATEAPKAALRDSHALKIGEFYPSVIANHHILNVALAINERSNLPPRFM
jgi:hypothetical protein